MSDKVKQLCRNVALQPKIFEIAMRDVAVGLNCMVMCPFYFFSNLLSDATFDFMFIPFCNIMNHILLFLSAVFNPEIISSAFSKSVDIIATFLSLYHSITNLFFPNTWQIKNTSGFDFL